MNANEKTIELLQKENAKLRETLEWYGEQARLCRLVTSEGEKGRQALDHDGGKKAQSVLNGE